MIPPKETSFFKPYAREGFLLTIRFWIFALTQSAFSIIADDYKEDGEWRIMENIALTACCCLVITLWSMAWEQCMVRCCGGIDTKNYYSSRFFRTYYWNSYDDVNNTNNNEIADEEDEGDDLIVNTLRKKQANDIIKCSDPEAFTWLLRGQSVSCGACLFVVAYSLHGMAWLPQVSMAAAGTLCCFFTDEELRKNRTRKAAALCVIIGVALLGANGFFTRPQEWTPHNMWLGVIMPAGSAAVLSKCSLIAARHNVRADRAVALSMPSVAIASLTFLSLYVPSPPKPASLHFSGNVTHSFYDGLASASAAWEYYYRLLRYNQLFPVDRNVSADTQYLYDIFERDAWMTQFGKNNSTANSTEGKMWRIARETLGEAESFIANQTDIYYPYLSAPTAIFSFGTIKPRGAAATLASVAAPLLLWGALTVFTAGFFRGRGKSTVAIWLLSAAVCQIWWRGVTLPLVALIVIVKLGLVFGIMPDEMLMRRAAVSDVQFVSSPPNEEVDEILNEIEISEHDSGGVQNEPR